MYTNTSRFKYELVSKTNIKRNVYKFEHLTNTNIIEYINKYIVDLNNCVTECYIMS